MRAIGYARVSQVGQRDMDSSSYRTEQQQQDSIRAAAEKIGAVVVELIVERNVSGGTMSAERERAIQRIEAGDADCLIVTPPDRLARNAELALAIRRRVRAAGGSIVSVEGADAD